jgi:hypothetical protein
MLGSLHPQQTQNIIIKLSDAQTRHTSTPESNSHKHHKHHKTIALAINAVKDQKC